eukprot:gene9491-6661_t
MKNLKIYIDINDVPHTIRGTTLFVMKRYSVGGPSRMGRGLMLSIPTPLASASLLLPVTQLISSFVYLSISLYISAFAFPLGSPTATGGRTYYSQPLHRYIWLVSFLEETKYLAPLLINSAVLRLHPLLETFISTLDYLFLFRLDFVFSVSLCETEATTQRTRIKKKKEIRSRRQKKKSPLRPFNARHHSFYQSSLILAPLRSEASLFILVVYLFVFLIALSLFTFIYIFLFSQELQEKKTYESTRERELTNAAESLTPPHIKLICIYLFIIIIILSRIKTPQSFFLISISIKQATMFADQFPCDPMWAGLVLCARDPPAGVPQQTPFERLYHNLRDAEENFYTQQRLLVPPQHRRIIQPLPAAQCTSSRGPTKSVSHMGDSGLGGQPTALLHRQYRQQALQTTFTLQQPVRNDAHEHPQRGGVPLLSKARVHQLLALVGDETEADARRKTGEKTTSAPRLRQHLQCLLTDTPPTGPAGETTATAVHPPTRVWQMVITVPYPGAGTSPLDFLHLFMAQDTLLRQRGSAAAAAAAARATWVRGPTPGVPVPILLGTTDPVVPRVRRIPTPLSSEEEEEEYEEVEEVEEVEDLTEEVDEVETTRSRPRHSPLHMTQQQTGSEPQPVAPASVAASHTRAVVHKVGSSSYPSVAGEAYQQVRRGTLSRSPDMNSPPPLPETSLSSAATFNAGDAAPQFINVDDEATFEEEEEEEEPSRDPSPNPRLVCTRPPRGPPAAAHARSAPQAAIPSRHVQQRLPTPLGLDLPLVQTQRGSMVVGEEEEEGGRRQRHLVRGGEETSTSPLPRRQRSEVEGERVGSPSVSVIRPASIPLARLRSRSDSPSASRHQHLAHLPLPPPPTAPRASFHPLGPQKEAEEEEEVVGGGERLTQHRAPSLCSYSEERPPASPPPPSATAPVPTTAPTSEMVQQKARRHLRERMARREADSPTPATTTTSRTGGGGGGVSAASHHARLSAIASATAGEEEMEAGVGRWAEAVRPVTDPRAGPPSGSAAEAELQRPATCDGVLRHPAASSSAPISTMLRAASAEEEEQQPPPHSSRAAMWIPFPSSTTGVAQGVGATPLWGMATEEEEAAAEGDRLAATARPDSVHPSRTSTSTSTSLHWCRRSGAQQRRTTTELLRAAAHMDDYAFIMDDDDDDDDSFVDGAAHQKKSPALQRPTSSSLSLLLTTNPSFLRSSHSSGAPLPLPLPGQAQHKPREDSPSVCHDDDNDDDDGGRSSSMQSPANRPRVHPRDSVGGIAPRKGVTTADYHSAKHHQLFFDGVDEEGRRSYSSEELDEEEETKRRVAHRHQQQHSMAPSRQSRESFMTPLLSSSQSYSQLLRLQPSSATDRSVLSAAAVAGLGGFPTQLTPRTSGGSNWSGNAPAEARGRPSFHGTALSFSSGRPSSSLNAVVAAGGGGLHRGGELIPIAPSPQETHSRRGGRGPQPSEPVTAAPGEDNGRRTRRVSLLLSLDDGPAALQRTSSPLHAAAAEAGQGRSSLLLRDEDEDEDGGNTDPLLRSTAQQQVSAAVSAFSTTAAPSMASFFPLTSPFTTPTRPRPSMLATTPAGPNGTALLTTPTRLDSVDRADAVGEASAVGRLSHAHEALLGGGRTPFGCTPYPSPLAPMADAPPSPSTAAAFHLLELEDEEDLLSCQLYCRSLRRSVSVSLGRPTINLVSPAAGAGAAGRPRQTSPPSPVRLGAGRTPVRQPPLPPASVEVDDTAKEKQQQQLQQQVPVRRGPVGGNRRPTVAEPIPATPSSGRLPHSMKNSILRTNTSASAAPPPHEDEDDGRSPSPDAVPVSYRAARRATKAGGAALAVAAADSSLPPCSVSAVAVHPSPEATAVTITPTGGAGPPVVEPPVGVMVPSMVIPTTPPAAVGRREEQVEGRGDETAKQHFGAAEERKGTPTTVMQSSTRKSPHHQAPAQQNMARESSSHTSNSSSGQDSLQDGQYHGWAVRPPVSSNIVVPSGVISIARPGAAATSSARLLLPTARPHLQQQAPSLQNPPILNTTSTSSSSSSSSMPISSPTPAVCPSSGGVTLTKITAVAGRGSTGIVSMGTISVSPSPSPAMGHRGGGGAAGAATPSSSSPFRATEDGGSPLPATPIPSARHITTQNSGGGGGGGGPQQQYPHHQQPSSPQLFSSSGSDPTTTRPPRHSASGSGSFATVQLTRYSAGHRDGSFYSIGVASAVSCTLEVVLFIRYPDSLEGGLQGVDFIFGLYRLASVFDSRQQRQQLLFCCHASGKNFLCVTYCIYIYIYIFAAIVCTHTQDLFSTACPAGVSMETEGKGIRLFKSIPQHRERIKEY